MKKKVEAVNRTIAEMKKYKTVALLDLRKLPDALFQSLRKRIREGGGHVLVLKKPVISRVLASNPILAKRADACNNPVALILTNMSSFEVNSFFKQNKKKRAAKAGDVALADIVVPEGETDLPPGPALSELKAGGLNVQIKAGKIAVVKDSTVAKAG
ncbi:MAG: 50S ribosomal protein L10, partial [Nitrososphaera sp.]|nr:50S ribosomal protein L10 [Nitrososphaera sp.]